MILVMNWGICMPLVPAQALQSLISPGDLSRPHESLSGLDQCLRCHTPGKGVDSGKCLDCHTEIARRLEEKRGFHRLAQGRCSQCHRDHQGVDFHMIDWDREGFQHSSTGVPLLGLHQQVAKCEDCHNSQTSLPRRLTHSYLIADPSCTTCHEDVHGGQLGKDCQRCHSLDRKFKAIEFDHSGTRFPLLGAHQSTKCQDCHRDKVWVGLPFSRCTDCHRDVHESNLGKDCRRCHSLANWKVGAASNPFDHSRTRYPLEGRHQEVACEKCHATRRFTGLEFEQCRDCHDDNTHKGQFRQDCSNCHTPEDFRPSSFRHDTFRYPLTGKHRDLACAACHPRENPSPALPESGFVRYTPRSTTCSGCHVDTHGAQFTQGCESCHTTGGFGREALTFVHDRDSDYPLLGKHAGTDCSGCHVRQLSSTPGKPGVVRYKPLSRECLTCHEDYHGGQLSANCRQCHGLDGFKPATRFDHGGTRFPLLGKHSSLQCGECHRPVQVTLSSGQYRQTPAYQLTASACGACHQNPHRSARSEQCQTCHEQESFRLPLFDHSKTSFALTGRHRKISCEACHPPALWNNRAVLTFQAQKGDCSTCHRSPHVQRYRECTRCHTTQTWRVTDW